MVLFTIGYGGKKASEFFLALRAAGVRKVVDVRLRPSSGMAGFARAADLAYFLHELCGIGYEYRSDLAPTADLLDDYHAGKVTWAEYEQRFSRIMDQRMFALSSGPADWDHACLLCAEASPDKCHRRLLAERIAGAAQGIEVRHL